MSEALKPGDTVQLKSGGPVMTVQSEAAEGYLVCAWFNSSGEHKKEVFAERLAPYSTSPLYATNPRLSAEVYA